MNKRVSDHFRSVDRVLYRALTRVKHRDDLTPRRTDDYFSDLCEAIINQQLSDKAAATIFGRFTRLFPKGVVTPQALLTIPDEKIRTVGTSWSKVKYLKSLAQSVVDKQIELPMLDALEDHKVIEKLTTLKGIGPWTAEMFLMFSLGREDVFSFGDLGLRKAIRKLYNFKKDPSTNELMKLTKKWSPYRTYAARILWRSLE